jgi:hypothetical protein
MLTLFRKIRKSFIENSSVRKYLLYAIGEILLVMIGILLALQVSNWNEVKKLDREERETLQALLEEFQSNQKIIGNCLSEMNEDRRYADSVRSHLGPVMSLLNIDTLNMWFGQIGATYRCQLITDVLEDIKSSGNIKMISNIDIRTNIAGWSSSLRGLQREEDDWAREFSSEFYPYTYSYMSWDDVDFVFNEEDPRFFTSKFEFDPRTILQQFEFSNVLSIHYWRMRRVIEQLEKLSTETKELLELIHLELTT